MDEMDKVDPSEKNMRGDSRALYKFYKILDCWNQKIGEPCKILFKVLKNTNKKILGNFRASVEDRGPPPAAKRRVINTLFI